MLWFNGNGIPDLQEILGQMQGTSTGTGTGALGSLVGLPAVGGKQ